MSTLAPHDRRTLQTIRDEFGYDPVAAKLAALEIGGQL